MAQIDLRRTTIRLSDGGSNYVDMSIGEGTLDFSVKREIEVVKNRGKLDTIRENEEVPLTVETAFIWEFLDNGGEDPPSIEDVLYRRGAASTWVSVSSDNDAPFCVNITIINDPECTGVLRELITLRQFHFESLDHSLREGAVALKGLCNAKAAQVSRLE